MYRNSCIVLFRTVGQLQSQSEYKSGQHGQSEYKSGQSEYITTFYCGFARSLHAIRCAHEIFEKQPEKHLYICTKISMYMVSNHSNKGWQTTIVWLEVGV